MLNLHLFTGEAERWRAEGWHRCGEWGLFSWNGKRQRFTIEMWWVSTSTPSTHPANTLHACNRSIRVKLAQELIPEFGSQLCGNVLRCESTKFFSHQAIVLGQCDPSHDHAIHCSFELWQYFTLPPHFQWIENMYFLHNMVCTHGHTYRKIWYTCANMINTVCYICYGY